DRGSSRGDARRGARTGDSRPDAVLRMGRRSGWGCGPGLSMSSSCARSDRDGVDAVLSLGALDTRAWRLPPRTDFPWIESDLPGIVAYKGERIGDRAPKCRLERLVVDLTDASARRQVLEHAASLASRILLLTEGLLGYLPAATVTQLVEEVSSLPAFGFWIFDTYARFPTQVREALGRVGSAT